MQMGQVAVMQGQHLARAQFVTWLKNTHPDLWQGIMQSELGGLGVHEAPEAVPERSMWEKIIDGATKVGSTYLQYEAQRKILKMNIERAQQGLPPLDPSIIGATPVIRTEIDISPEMAAGLKQKLGMGIGTIALIGAGVLLLLFMRR